MASTMPNQGDANSVSEHMTRLNMKLLQQKLDNARQKQEPQGAGDADARLDPNRVRYHQSLLKRHELLERIKAANGRDTERLGEQGNEEGKYTNRVESLPAMSARQHSEQTPYNNPRQQANPVTEPRVQHLPAAQQPEELETRAPRIPAYPQPSWMSSYPPYPPPPAPAAPIMYNQYPVIAAPTILPVPSMQPQSNKSEYVDMMIMQNAQMHQLFMQQLLAQGLRPKEEPATVVIDQQPAAPLLPQPQVITLGQHKRPRSRHHHHYTQLPPIVPNERSYQINHIQHVEDRKPSPVRPPTPERKPPSPQVIPRPRPLPVNLPVRTIQSSPRLPRSDALRKLRHIAYAAWFVSFLKIAARKRKEDDKFLFGIRLKEAVAGLHNIYLNPDGNIYPLLRDNISPGATDLTLAFDANQNAVLQELIYTIENLIFHITDIMPRTGVLGTHKKAVVFEMLQEGKVYPEGYFWKIEQERVAMNEEKRTVEMDDEKARILLIGMFLSRGLITTLLMKPLDYGVSSTLLNETAEENLKLMASILVYIVRKVSAPVKLPMWPSPQEMTRYLYSDEELKPLLAKIQKTIDYADELLRGWMAEYIRRLKKARNVQ